MSIPDEGETLILNVLLKRILTDRDADLELLLYTNAGLNLETATKADKSTRKVSPSATVTGADG